MIPDYQTIMLPLLKSLSGSKEKSPQLLRQAMVEHFDISDDEQKEKTQKGGQILYHNRVAWALVYLKMGELISSPKRGKYIITDIGEKILTNPPKKITTSFLRSLPNFPDKKKSEKKLLVSEEERTSDKTPNELIDIGYSQINTELSSQLISQIMDCSPFFFENLVLDLLLSMGYGGSEIENGEVTSRGADEGIDGIIKEDKLGLDKIYIQAKKWADNIGRPEIQKFVGALHGKRAKKGVFITTSHFSKEAVEYAKNLDVAVVLIDGTKLTELMIENDIGVSVKNTYKIRKIDTDYFEEQ